MKVKINWINTGAPELKDCGNWRSVEGRYQILPSASTEGAPYTITDKHWVSVYTQARRPTFTSDTVEACKQWALYRIEDELRKELPERAAQFISI